MRTKFWGFAIRKEERKNMHTVQTPTALPRSPNFIKNILGGLWSRVQLSPLEKKFHGVMINNTSVTRGYDQQNICHPMGLWIFIAWSWNVNQLFILYWSWYLCTIHQTFIFMKNIYSNYHYQNIWALPYLCMTRSFSITPHNIWLILCVLSHLF